MTFKRSRRRTFQLTHNIGRMALKKAERHKQKFNPTKESTWMNYYFMQEGFHCYCVEFLVLTVGRNKFIPKVKSSGKVISVGMIVPFFPFQYDRFEQTNKKGMRSTRTVIKQLAFEKSILDMRMNLRMKKGGNIESPDVITPYL